MTKNRVVEKNGEYSHINYQENVICTLDGSKTLLELLLNRCEIDPNGKYLGTIVGKEVLWLNFSTVKMYVERLSSFFNSILEPKSIVGIYSVNRYEWIVSEYASYMSNCINCPLYSTFGSSALSVVLNETKMKACVASADKAESLLKNVLGNESKSYLSHIILLDKEEKLKARLEEKGIAVTYFNDIISCTEVIELRGHKLKHSDLATICYTSGTSGVPKGCMLTHKNFISTIAAYSRGVNDREFPVINSKSVYLSYLPLAHVMERICVSIFLANGGSVAFYRGNPKTLKDDYPIIRPTFIATVPRVLNVFMQNIEAEIKQKNVILRTIFRIGVKYKIWLQNYGIFKSWIWDSLVFNKVASAFGGRIQGCLCGSASLKPEVHRYLQAVLSCRIFQGYGQTESVGSSIVTPMDYLEYDCVGIPFPNNKVKLKPVNGYGSDCGEILLMGDNITEGYYKRPDLTAEIFDEEGWLKTGDIARFADGTFKIVGRRKDIFKTSLGEYIVPEKLESMYLGGIVEDIFITGSKYSDYIAAIVVCRDNAVKDEDVKEHIEKIGLRLVDEKKIVKFEIPSFIKVIRNGFDEMENGNFVTPTAKKIRSELERYFKEDINALLN